MPQRRFPRPWRFEPIPGGYRVIDANGLALAHVYGQPPAAIAFSDQRLTDDEAEKIAELIVGLPRAGRAGATRGRMMAVETATGPERWRRLWAC